MALISEYDEKWSGLDVAGVAALVGASHPPADLYRRRCHATPLVGVEALDRRTGPG